MNQRTGTLQLSTAQGAGELRLQDGDVVDAVHRSFEGRKALFRLLGESEGTFTFVSTTGTVLRRIEEPTRTLLFEGLRQVDETRRLMRSFAAGRDSFCAVVDATVATNQLEASVLERLATPTSVSELLDSLPDEDLAVLETLAALLERHALARVARPETRVSLASEDEMTVLGALVRRRRRLGFDGQLRILLASDSARLARVRRSLSGIDGAVVSPQGSGTSFLRPLALLRVGDGAEMELVGVEDVPGLVPLLGLVLGGCQALVTLDCEASPALVSACELYGVALHAGEELLGEIDPEDPAQLAAMIRALLTVEAATGD